MPLTQIVDQSNNNPQLTLLDGLVGYAHKVSEGHTFYDKLAAPRLQAAILKGLRYVIPYHVIRAGATPGSEQARYFIDCCWQAGLDITQRGVICMNDWEGWNDGFATQAQADGFNMFVNDYVGRECVINYGGLPNPYNLGNNIWLADYRSRALAQTNPLWNRSVVWQWGNKAVGGGDTNEILTQDWLDHLAGYTLDPQETPVATLVQIPNVITFVSEQPPPTYLSMWWVQTQDEVNFWLDRGAALVGITRDQAKGIRLQGTMPPGFTAADFRDWAGPGTPGPKGDKGDTGPAPHGNFPITGGQVAL